MILESGLSHGPLWLYVLMVIVAGITALYTTRCVWMVFFGEPKSEYHAHPVGAAMKTALVPLALAALVSWLVIKEFSGMMGETSLPYHGIEKLSLGEMAQEVFSLPTLVVLILIAISIGLWFLREKLSGVVSGLKSLRWAAENSFGFEVLNSAIVKVTQTTAEALRRTQTGILGWNVLGIIATAIILFVILALGG